MWLGERFGSDTCLIVTMISSVYPPCGERSEAYALTLTIGARGRTVSRPLRLERRDGGMRAGNPPKGRPGHHPRTRGIIADE